MSSWIDRAPMPTPRHDLQSIAVEGEIYAISGADDLTLDVVEIYDVATDSWRAGPPIPTARGWLGAALMEGKIYVGCGKTIRTREEQERTGDNNTFNPRDALEILDLETQTWSARSPMPAGPRAGLSVTACKGKIWAIGGNTMIFEDQRILDRVEVYDPGSDVWEPGPALPRPIQGPTVVTHDELIYLTGGISDDDDEGQYRNETYVLDPDVGRWESLAPVPTARESSGATVLGNLIYTFGGKYEGGVKAATNEVYDIGADRWFVEAPMPVSCCWLDACTVGDQIFAMGGAHHIKGGYKWLDDLYEFVP